MSQQPLAFTIVKTVVTARDEARALPAPLAAAWAMLREELGTQARAAIDIVEWGPRHQEGLRHVIDGVKDCFINDVELEREFATLLDETERVRELAEDLTEVPIVEPPQAEPPQAEPPQAEPTPAVPAATDIMEEVSPPVAAASAEAIPMIDLSDDLLADAPARPSRDEVIALDPAPPAAAERGESTPPPTEVATPAPVSTPPIAPERPTVSPRPTPPSRILLALGALGGLALLVLLAFWLLGDSTAAADEREEASPTVSTPPAVPTAPEVSELRAARDYAGARAAQRDYLSALEASNAPPALAAAATAELAELSALADDPSAAVASQRRALSLTKAAYGEDGAEAADAHLAIVSYYLDTDERHMAEAHYRQARKMLRGLPNALNEERASALQQLGDRLGVSE